MEYSIFKTTTQITLHLVYQDKNTLKPNLV